MRILITSAVLTPEMGKHYGTALVSSGGWISSMIGALRRRYPQVAFGVVTAHPSIPTGNHNVEGVQNYVIQHPFRSMMDMPNARFVAQIANVVRDFSPDLVHVNGSEFFYGMAVKKAMPNLPAVLSIQGIASLCEGARRRAIPGQTRLRYYTFRDFLATVAKRNRSVLERETIASFSHVIGRTDWDRANIRAFNPKASYYCVNELLRPEFAESKWAFQNVELHSVFSNSGGTPAKGTHTLIEAISLLRADYPNVKVRIPGMALQMKKRSRLGWQTKGYLNFLCDLVRKLDVSGNVVGLPSLSAKQMADELATSHVFALASHMENSSNSLAEAMQVGTPCVASYCGGTGSMLKDHSEGLMYPTGDAVVLAEHIRTLFENQNLCRSFSSNAKTRAIARHDEKSVVDSVIRVYQAVIQGSP